MFVFLVEGSQPVKLFESEREWLKPHMAKSFNALLVDRKEIGQVILLGSHGKNTDTDKDHSDSLPKDIVAKIAADISNSLQNANLSGYSQVLMDLLKDSLKTKMSIRKSLLADYATRRKIDNFREYFKRPQNRISPIPIYPSKRDLVLLACNIWPGYFRNKIQQDHVETKGIAIYLDVSGSVNKYLPEILGILNHLKNDIRSAGTIEKLSRCS